MTKLPINRLEKSTFDVYGEVVEHECKVQKRMLHTPFSSTGKNALAYQFSVNRLKRSMGQKILIDTLERHPHSAQTFIPLTHSRHLVVVALSTKEGGLQTETLKAFITNGSQGVSYHPGVWHFAFTSVDEDSNVAVILGLTGKGDDTEYVDIPTSVVVPLTEECMFNL